MYQRQNDGIFQYDQLISLGLLNTQVPSSALCFLSTGSFKNLHEKKLHCACWVHPWRFGHKYSAIISYNYVVFLASLLSLLFPWVISQLSMLMTKVKYVTNPLSVSAWVLIAHPSWTFSELACLPLLSNPFSWYVSNQDSLNEPLKENPIFPNPKRQHHISHPTQHFGILLM